ncbi:2-oxo-4-hydroxy-4-carboxy-5-ureidoimidazoline decarboxylase [Streptomyces sp. NBC_00094]|uniref:2-oxo-4-hydroxy-4-carboxy-5-ureidoimidazoline decarboxylase n=1 Tax=Streptomyces sp. NBC_00094 TaxID=2903620 RepID=UPI002254E966|nr:2-oxo-4-hydroxy-4-carboxy-5-ureidoimidazoline decarboxylase [Streptomyces sp. NBC_00094]MCX5392730.1 2-oxo-4-hydroxy-4-carboxy-5-ureidoimidazoline decarboxylase [Streptomyces sp. NBC_00094]
MRYAHPTRPGVPEPTLTSDTHAPYRKPGSTDTPAIPAQNKGPNPQASTHGLTRFNAASPAEAETLLLSCCHSPRWAERVAAHRPYPTVDALLAAADEAGYDLSRADLDGALAAESSALPHPDAPSAARTALRAAHAAYESSFGHAFVISLEGVRPGERLDQVLAGIRSRLGNEPEEERVIAADELRRLARARLAFRLSEGLTLRHSEA